MRISDLPAHLPRLPNGRRVSVATVYRYTLAGVRGLRLRRFKIGGSWATTLEEVGRWTAALTRRAGGDS